MRIALAGICIILAVALLWSLMQSAQVMQWAVAQQRVFQNHMADAVFGLKNGAPGAWAALLGAAAAYGFVHAAGPGHGKFLIGGVGLGTSVSARRLLGLAAASSIAQSVWAILLVYGGFAVFETTAEHVTGVAQDYLTPASYCAISAIGAYLVLRGGRRLLRRKDHAHVHDEECGCHGHGPSVQEASAVRSVRDALALIASIAIRPCTGALFLLVIAWNMDIKAAGAVAVITMGLGTASLTSLVAVSSILARRITAMTSGQLVGTAVALSVLQVLVGGAILWAGLLLLINSL